jgi:hypothetical protein
MSGWHFFTNGWIKRFNEKEEDSEEEEDEDKDRE